MSADKAIMATILELAREVRHHLVARATGCLTIFYADGEVSIDLADGVIVTPRDLFLPCFRRDPDDFQFRTTDVRPPEGFTSGASLLIEALEGIDDATLLHVWTPYSNWKIGFREDPEIHNTLIRDHLTGRPERLRRLMRFAVSGVIKLEPPPKKTLTEEIGEIRKSAQAGDSWSVLGVPRNASVAEIKGEFRKLALRFHPDRLQTNDPAIREKAASAFRDIHQAYKNALANHTKHPAATPVPPTAAAFEESEPQPAERPCPPKSPPKQPLFRRLYDFVMAR